MTSVEEQSELNTPEAMAEIARLPEQPKEASDEERSAWLADEEHYHKMTWRFLEGLHSNGWEQAFIIGKNGNGKTTYSCHTAFQLHAYGLTLKTLEDYERIWDIVQANLYFDPLPFYDKFKGKLKERKAYLALKDMDAANRCRIPQSIFDDAGVHFSKFMWFYKNRTAAKYSWQEKVSKINSTFNLIRSGSAGCVFTSLDDDIIKELVKKSWVIGEPTPLPGASRSSLSRVCSLYDKWQPAWNLRKSYSSPVGRDRFRLWLPKTFREIYEMRKNEAEILNLEELDEEDTDPNAMRDAVLKSPAVKSLVYHDRVIMTAKSLGYHGDVAFREMGRVMNADVETIRAHIHRHNELVKSVGECQECKAMENNYSTAHIDAGISEISDLPSEPAVAY